MNCSVDNLISLSDSGVGSSLSTSASVSTPAVSQCGEHLVDDAFAIFQSTDEGGNAGILDMTPPGTNGGTGLGIEDNGGTGVLIDFSDEVQVPVQEGILRQAEIDDTFGIFSMAQQSSQGSVGGSKNSQDKLIADDDEEDEAAKLVRSFTSGRKSDGAVEKKKKPEAVKSEQTEDKDIADVDKINVSDESVASDQPTIVDSEGSLSPKLPDDDDGEKIMDKKMDLTSSTNMSGGSDSEILDIGNLSSFSIPEEEIDDSKFIEDIKREDMAGSSITRAVVNQIKLDILQGDDEEDEDDNYLTAGRSRSSSISSRLRDAPYAISEITRPSLVSNSTVSTYSSRLSSSSTTSTGTNRWSSSSQQKNSTVLGDLWAGTNSNGVSTSTTNTKSRLSSGNFGSPIRASYPVSNRYFMPTPKTKTPSAAAYTPNRDRHTYRDRLSESLLSPSRTRVMLVTGDSHRSPSRAPVRKSISAETLHYEYSSPSRETQRQVIKFSTPAASNRTRNSFSIQPSSIEYPNFFGDDRPPANHGTYTGIEVLKTGRPEFTQYRGGRLSYASTASNNSIHTLSPSTCIYSKEVNKATRQMNQINLDDSFNGGVNTNVQPVRVTAVIAPTNISKPTIKQSALSTTTAKVGFQLPTKPKTTGQEGHTRPIAASSPVPPPPTSGRPGSNQTTPTRSKYGVNVRSSGYGAQQNLNSTFGANQALKSPNKATSTSASIKPAAIPRSLKTGVPSLGNKIELGTRGGGSTTTTRIGGLTALKPGGKLPAPSSTGLRRPGTSTAVSASNKENKPRSSTATGTSRIGLMQRYHQ